MEPTSRYYKIIKVYLFGTICLQFSLKRRTLPQSIQNKKITKKKKKRNP